MECRGVLHGKNLMNITIRYMNVDAYEIEQKEEKCENQLTRYGTYFEASYCVCFDKA